MLGGGGGGGRRYDNVRCVDRVRYFDVLSGWFERVI